MLKCQTKTKLDQNDVTDSYRKNPLGLDLGENMDRSHCWEMIILLLGHRFVTDYQGLKR